MSGIFKANRILLVHVSGRVGDSLLITPFISALRNFSKKSTIDLYAHRNRVDLFYNNPNLNFIKSLSKKRARLKGWFTFNKYDYVIIFNYFENCDEIIRFALRVGKKVVAFEPECMSLKKKLYISQARILDKANFIDRLFLIATRLGIDSKDRRIKFYNTPSEILTARKNLRDNKVLTKNFIIGAQLSCFSSHSYRDWPIENFLSLFRLILKYKKNTKFIIFGTKEDKLKINYLKDKLKGDNQCIIDFTCLSLRDTGALMSQINLYIGVDTGPSQLMSSFNIPFVCLYHALFPSSVSGPKEHPLALLIDSKLGKDNLSSNIMLSITPKHVFNKLKKFLL